MSLRFTKIVSVYFLYALLLTPSSQAQTGKPGKCTESAEFYEGEGYKVGDIQIDAPLDWLLGSVDKKLNQLITDPSMPIRKGEPFRKADADAGFLKINESFPELRVNPFSRIAFRITRPSLENCNAQARTLDVIYRVYTFTAPYYLSRSFEGNAQQLAARSVVETPATERLANYFLQPYFAYNRSRRGYGGGRLSISQPRDLLDKISLEASGSSSSLTARAEADGSRELEQGAIRHTEWRFGYHYSDVPSNSAQLRESKGLGQFFAATRALGPPEFVLRFGGSIEGGNQHTDADPGMVSAGDLLRTGYVSGKAFVGAMLRIGGRPFDGTKPQDVDRYHSLELRWKGSYGLQVGNTGEDQPVDYVKHIFDTAVSLRLLVRNHRPITIDTQFTAGTINTLGRLPVTERFFGGNVEQNFIAGETWKIRSQPFIRSFPQNRLSQTTANGVIGGDSFFSANLTIAATIWGKPLVPDELLRDKEFPGLVEILLNVAESELRNGYLSQTPKFRAIAEEVKPIAELLQLVTKDLVELEKAVQQELGDHDPGPQLIEQIESSRTCLESPVETVQKITKDLEKNEQTTGDLRELVVGFPKKKPPFPSTIEELEDSLQSVTDVPGLPGDGIIADKIGSLNTLREKLEKSRNQIAEKFTEFDSSSIEAIEAARRAKREMVYPRRALNHLFHEANLIAISPVFVFDAARIRQNDLKAGDVRYAIGGGLRLSIVSLDFTFGYAWNPNPKPWEGRGAAIFTMELSNLFR